MHAKRNYQKQKKKRKISVRQLSSNSAASQRCRKFGNSSFLLVKLQQPFNLVFHLRFTIQKSDDMTPLSANLSPRFNGNPFDYPLNTRFSDSVLGSSIYLGQRKCKCCPCSSLILPYELHHWDTWRLLLQSVRWKFLTKDQKQIKQQVADILPDHKR